MPVIKNIGKNDTITVKVARMVGGLTSSTAVNSASSGDSLRNL